MFTKLREHFRAFFSAQARQPPALPEELQFLDSVVRPFLNEIQAAYELAIRFQHEVTALRTERDQYKAALEKTVQALIEIEGPLSPSQRACVDLAREVLEEKGEGKETP